MIGQLGGMYNGDRARKTTLVEYGFRLPSALDNRPLKFEEFERQDAPGGVRLGDAGRPTRSDTPGRWSSSSCGRPAWSTRWSRCGRRAHQVDDVLQEIRERVEAARAGPDHDADQADGRAAHRLPGRQRRQGALPAQRHRDASSGSRSCATCAWAHSTCWSGINLLREGLDIPEVSLVAILDADKEGFLRSERSLIQTIGRAARNLNGRAILYADQVTDSMQAGARRDRAGAAAARLAHNPSRRASRRAASSSRSSDLIDGVYSDKSAQGRPEAARTSRRRSRSLSEKDLGKRDQAARAADARARPQPRIREGGAGPRPAGASCASRRSAPRCRQRRR